MHALIAPDKFKGSLSAAEVAAAIADGIAAVDPSLLTTQLPVADGGEGTVAAAVQAGWSAVNVATRGPTGCPHAAGYAANGDRAVVELASVAGVAALPGGIADPLGASTFGLGTVIAHALDHGARDIVVGIGGSASTDGGAGMLQALGARILDLNGDDIAPGGGQLRRARRLRLDGLHPRLRTARIQVACDVDSPLLGPEGAAATYAPQKGADTSEVTILGDAMTRWAQLVQDTVGRDLACTPGAGAAGGTGFGLMAVLAAHPRPGIEVVLELVDFRSHLLNADLVITGEGSLDEQTLRGKAPAGVAAAARARGVPVFAVAGRNLLTRDERLTAGIDAVFALTDIEPDRDRCMVDTACLLRQLACRIISAADPFGSSTRLPPG